MINSAAALESTLEKIARIMARRRGIKVVLRGGMAYCDLEKLQIVLPRVTDAQYNHMAEVIDGICDHETGHVLWSSPLVVKEVSKDPVRQWVWNVIEDFWTERRTGQEYLGCGQNIAKSNRKLVEWWKKTVLPKAGILDRLCFAIGCVLRGEKVVSDFLSDKEVGALLQTLVPELEDAQKVSSSPGALEAADRILAKIKDLAQPESKEGEGDEKEKENSGVAPQEGASDGDAESVEGDEGENKDDGNGDGRGDRGAETQSGENEAGEDCDGGNEEGADGGDEESNDGAEQGAEGNEGVSQADADSKGIEKDEGGISSEARQQAENFQSQAESGRMEKPADINDFANAQMTEFQDWSKLSDPDQYVVFSTEWDSEVTYSVDERVRYAKLYAELCDDVKPYIGTMSTALEMALAAEAEANWGVRNGLERKSIVANWPSGLWVVRMIPFIGSLKRGICWIRL